MHRIGIILALVALLGLSGFLNGCTVYDVAVEERNVGTWANDSKIGFLVEQEFLSDDLVKYLDFDAASYEGRVYITGEYESRAQVDRAVKLAKSVEGVRSVTTFVLPKRDDDLCGTTDNLDIHARVKEKLVNDSQIWSTNINIEVVQCNVILLGVMGSQNEIDRAIAHAHAVKGVRKVKSFLRVKR